MCQKKRRIHSYWRINKKGRVPIMLTEVVAPVPGKADMNLTGCYAWMD